MFKELVEIIDSSDYRNNLVTRENLMTDMGGGDMDQLIRENP